MSRCPVVKAIQLDHKDPITVVLACGRRLVEPHGTKLKTKYNCTCGTRWTKWTIMKEISQFVGLRITISKCGCGGRKTMVASDGESRTVFWMNGFPNEFSTESELLKFINKKKNVKLGLHG